MGKMLGEGLELESCRVSLAGLLHFSFQGGVSQKIGGPSLDPLWRSKENQAEPPRFGTPGVIRSSGSWEAKGKPRWEYPLFRDIPVSSKRKPRDGCLLLSFFFPDLF